MTTERIEDDLEAELALVERDNGRLSAENLRLRKSLEKIKAGRREGRTYSDLLDIADFALTDNKEETK